MNDAPTPAFFASADGLPAGARRVDGFESALRELYFVENPEISKHDTDVETKLAGYLSSRNIADTWAYYPWNNVAIRIPSEDTYYRLRTARNRDLISDDEQKKFRNCVVGVVGLSVGSAAAALLARTGGPKRIKLADPDIVEITNLNRMNARVRDIGTNKADVAAREIWEVDPFAEIQVWRDGVSRDTLGDFIAGEPRLDVFVDEMDDIPLKFACRLLCKEHKVPVVMATDNGDGVIVDVERFDIEPERPIFHGRVDPAIADTAKTRAEFIAAASAIIDPAYFTERQTLSLSNIGKTLSGVAQIGSAVAIAGAAISYVVRQIAIGADMPSGRYVISCEQAFGAAAGKQER